MYEWWPWSLDVILGPGVDGMVFRPSISHPSRLPRQPINRLRPLSRLAVPIVGISLVDTDQWPCKDSIVTNRPHEFCPTCQPCGVASDTGMIMGYIRSRGGALTPSSSGMRFSTYGGRN